MLSETKSRKTRRTKQPSKSAKKSSARENAAAYVVKHVKLVGRSPNGRPIYKYEDLKKLNLKN